MEAKRTAMSLNLTRSLFSTLFLAGVLLLAGNSPIWSAEKLSADYGETSGFQSPLGAESLKIVARYMRTSEKDIVEETYNDFSPILSPVPRTNLEGIQEILNEEAKRLPGASRWKPTDFVRESLLNEREREGFTQKFR